MMSNWKRGGVLAAFAALTASLLAARTGDGRPAGERVAAPRTAARTHAAADYVVGVQMTGLLLLVPSGGKTYVLLPASPTGRLHTALLGFGFPSRTPPPDDLCIDRHKFGNFGQRAWDAGICYVNLKDWRVGPIAGTGTVPTIDSLEAAGALSMTRGSGGNRVRRSDVDHLRRVILEPGWPLASCGIGRWRFRPFGKSPETRRVADVLTWVFRKAQGTTLDLVFTNLADTTRAETVHLNGEATGSLGIVLAHIPDGEVDELPPGMPHGPHSAGAETREHFRAYYGLLNHPGPVLADDPHRPFPLFPDPTDENCQLEVGTQRVKFRAVGTYACMPASGEMFP